MLSNTDSDGRLRNAAYDLDARTVAILSKRHQISVSKEKRAFDVEPGCANWNTDRKTSASRLC